MATFSLLWALSLVVHIWQYSLREPSLSTWALLSAACLVFLFPRNALLLVLTASIQLIHLFQSLPYVANSWLFTGFAGLTILWGYFVCAVPSKTPLPENQLFLRTIAIPLRAETIVLYFISAFHKLNQDFFNPDLSCAVKLYRSYAELTSFLPQSVTTEHGVILAAVLTEFSIVICLSIPRWRWGGVILAFVFHYFLSLIPLVSLHSFSFLMYAMTSLFLKTEGTNEAPRHASPMFIFRLFLVVVFLAFAVSYSGLNFFDFQRHTLSIFARIVGLLFCVLLLSRAILRSRSLRALKVLREHESIPYTFRWAHVFFPALVLLNGLQPYLGLSTGRSFSMYSNLRTEAAPNHFLLRGIPQAFKFQNGVRIISSNDAELRSYSERNLLIPYFNLQKILFTHPDAEATYLFYDSNTPQQTGEQERDGYSTVLGKILLMRETILFGQENRCRH